jgi:protease I
MRLREERADVTIAGPSTAPVRGKHALTAAADVTVEEIAGDEFDAVVVPGGWAPDTLRRSQAVKDLVKAADDRGAIVAMICHGGWVGASAGIVAGHRATGSTGIMDDLVNAGATWVDEPAFRDGNLVWGRVVEDIPAWCAVLVDAIATG